jgi:hypothetical protein
VTVPQILAESWTSMAEINPDARTQENTCDLEVDPGKTATGTILGPDDKPLSGALIWGAEGTASEGLWASEPLPTAQFTARVLDPARPRPLVFLHNEKRLAGSLLVRGNEKGPVVVRLRPWGTITGRVVSPEGQPRARAHFSLQFLVDVAPQIQMYPPDGHPKPGFWTDRDGRFRIEGLAPGIPYRLVGAHLTRSVSVKAGETRDLGDLRPKSDE